LTNSDPEPWFFSSATTFQAYCLCLAGSVPIREITSAPRWEVAHTGPYLGCLKLAPRPGCGFGVHQRGQLAGLGIDHRHLVGSIGRHQEVALGRIPAAVMQELGGLDGGFLEVLDIGVIHQPDHAGFLDVDHPLRLILGRHDGGHARFGVILAIHILTAGRHDLQRLERIALGDHVLRRPVGAGDRVLVLVALELGGFHRTRLDADLDGSHHGGFLVPHVDQVELAVAADHIDIAAGLGHARNVHGISGFHNAPDLLGVAVDQRHFAGITQGHREHVLQVDLVHLLLGPVFRLDDQLPAVHHVFHSPLGRRIRRNLDVFRHHRDFFLGQDVVEVDHPAIGPVADDVLQP